MTRSRLEYGRYVQRHEAECGERGRTLKKRGSRVTDDEAFTRLYYYATVQMGMSAEEFWLMPIGLFLDLWAFHKQWNGLENPKRELFVDEIILDSV